jgi:integrase
MASIKKDGDSWYFIIDLPRDPVTNARRQKKKRGFKTKKEAQAAAATLLHELTRGTHVEETDMSFEEFSKVWISDYALLGSVKESTVRARNNEVMIWLRYFNKIPIKNITKKMYQNAITDMKKSGLADNTISGVHGAGRMIFKRALEQDLVKLDPTQFTRLPKTVTTVDDLENRTDIPKYLEKEELALFLKTALERGLDGDYEAFLTLAYTGMRIGEFVVLRESDINFEENTISITKTYYNPTNNMVNYKLQTPKTKNSTRIVEVDHLVIDTLKSYIASNKEFKMLHRKTYYDKGYILPNKESHPGYPRTIKQYNIRMSRLLKLAGLNESLTPHSLRHTHVSLLAEAQVPLQEIMDRLGHKDDDTTKQVYLHVTKTRKKEASQKFGELMRNL